MPGCSICSDLREFNSIRALRIHESAVHGRRVDEIMTAATPEERAQLRAGFRAWTSGLAYLSGSGYRLRAEPRQGARHMGAAPWSATVRRLIPDSGLFHFAAKRWSRQQDARKRRRPSTKRPARKGRKPVARGGRRAA